MAGIHQDSTKIQASLLRAKIRQSEMAQPQKGASSKTLPVNLVILTIESSVVKRLCYRLELSSRERSRKRARKQVRGLHMSNFKANKLISSSIRSISTNSQ